jgi:hypothetical protein
VLLPLRLFELNGTATRPVHSRSPRCCVLRILKPRTLSVAGYARRLFFCGCGFAPVTCWTSIVVSKLHAHTTALPLLPCERAASYHSRSDPNMAHAPAEVHDLAHLVLCCPCAWAGGLDGVWAAHDYRSGGLGCNKPFNQHPLLTTDRRLLSRCAARRDDKVSSCGSDLLLLSRHKSRSFSW